MRGVYVKKTLLLVFSLGAVVALDVSPLLTVELNNGNEIPLIGLGVGNMAHEQIPSVLQTAVSKHGVSFIDTASASRNEALIVEAISKTGHSEVQVLTKVWYTYLGYARTKLSVRDSLANLASFGDVGPVSVLLHWPRCNPAISWMDCEGEEAGLPREVKDAGPPPHLDPGRAWQDSWRALEDMYLAGDINNIGVSNFDLRDLMSLLTSARVKPQILQGNVWSLVFDSSLLTLCRDHGIVFQAYNVMNGLLSVGTARNSPKAFQVLRVIGGELERKATALNADSPSASASAAAAAAAAAQERLAAAAEDSDPRCRAWAFNEGQCFENPGYMLASCATSCAVFHRDRPHAVGPAAVVLRWLAQQQVATVPRAASLAHLAANSPFAVGAVPELSERQVERVTRAARALLSGNDEGGSFVDAPFDDDGGSGGGDQSGGGGEGKNRAAATPAAEAALPVVATFVNSYVHEAPTAPNADADGGARKGGGVRRSNGSGPRSSAAAESSSHHAEEVHAKAVAAAAALVSVFWVHQDTGEEVLVAGPLKPGETASLHTHPGHTFIARHAHHTSTGGGGGGGYGGGGGGEGGTGGAAATAPVMGAGHSRHPSIARFEVTAPSGGSQQFHIGADSGEL